MPSTLVGARVVRGPDWKWDNQDGGKGGVGTIISIYNTADESKASKTVKVYWDEGTLANYRAGYGGYFDLLILDSAPAGIKFTSFTCNGCLSVISGMRWGCGNCLNYDLCTVCYMNDVHNDERHRFWRIELPNDPVGGVLMGFRHDLVKTQAHGLFPVATVRIGKDWSDSDARESKFEEGRVISVCPWQDRARSGIAVRWGNSTTMCHRVGYQGKVDVSCINHGKGYNYYEEHLPKAYVRSSREERLKIGDKVTIHLDVGILKAMAAGHGGWFPPMEEVIGTEGRVVNINEKGDAIVGYVGDLGSMSFNPAALYKIPDLKEGDKVRVLDNHKIVRKLQGDSWEDNMQEVLGMVGEVLFVNEQGKATVSLKGYIFCFNAAVLTLEYGEVDRDTTRVLMNEDELYEEQLVRQIRDGGASISDDLVIASYQGNMKQVKKIVESHKAKINHRLSNGKCALHMACRHSQVEIANYLLQKGADKNIKDENDITPLHDAAIGDKTALCLQLLLGNPAARVNDLNSAGLTPLHLAAYYGNKLAVGALTQFPHCDLNIQDVFGNTPLHNALLMGKSDIFLDILGAEGVDPTLCNKEGLNLLFLACIQNNTKAIEELIKKYPVLLEIENEEGWFPLHVAVLNNQCENAKIMLQSSQCNINIRHKNKQQTPLYLAVAQSFRNMIELLLEYRPNVNSGDVIGNTPLHVAVRKHCMCAFENTMSHEVSIDYRRDSYLDHAIAVSLVTHEANVNCRNNEGKTPLDFCTDSDLTRDLMPDLSPRDNLKHQRSEHALTHGEENTTLVKSPANAIPAPVESGTSPLQNEKKQPLPSPLPFEPLVPTKIDSPQLQSQCEMFPSLPSALTLSPTSPYPDPKKNSNCEELPSSSKEDGVTQQGKNNKAAKFSTSVCFHCEESEAVVVFKPCKHRIVCEECARKMKSCSKCNTKIEDKVAKDGSPLKPPDPTIEKKMHEHELKVECRICMERDNSMLLSCGHPLCDECSTCETCPVCEATVKDRRPIYF